MSNRKLLLISNDQNLIEIIQQLEGFELTISPHSWYVDSSDKYFDVVIVDADFARITVNIEDTIAIATVAFAVISPDRLADLLVKHRKMFFDIWVRPIYLDLLYERIFRAFEYRQMYQPFSDILDFYAREIRSPIGSIKGYADVLLSGVAGELTELQMQYLKAMKSNTEIVESIIPKNLSLITGGRLVIKPELINFHEVLLQEAKNGAKNGVDLVLYLPEELPLIFSDMGVLGLIYQSIDRIIQLCPQDNRKISISALKVDPKQISVTILVYGNETLAPMPRRKISEFLPKLSSENQHDSTVRSICTYLSTIDHLLYQVGSDAYFESEIGKGSTFYFTLPIAQS